MNEQQATPGTGASRQRQTGSGQGALDIEKLAEKVYQLMRTDARVCRARGQRQRQRETGHGQ
jgi:hypothetical protein